MGNKRVSNISIIFFTICVLIILVLLYITNLLNDQHKEKLMYAMESKVEYYAKRCYLENNCEGEITLSDLYERNYLTEIVNPVTKEVINYDTKIKYENEEIIIEWQ